MEYPKDCNTKDFPCSYPECNCGNIEEPPPQPEIALSYEQLEKLYFTQCECTDEWADKYKLSQEENEKLIHDLSEYISIANISTTQLAQAQAEKAELVRRCAEIAEGILHGNTPPDVGSMAILSLLPNDQRSE